MVRSEGAVLGAMSRTRAILANRNVVYTRESHNVVGPVSHDRQLMSMGGQMRPDAAVR